MASAGGDSNLLLLTPLAAKELPPPPLTAKAVAEAVAKLLRSGPYADPWYKQPSMLMTVAGLSIAVVGFVSNEIQTLDQKKMKQEVTDSTEILREMKLSYDKGVEILGREVAELKKYKEESQRREEILRGEIHGLKKYNEALEEDLKALKTRWAYKLFGSAAIPRPGREGRRSTE